MRTLLALALGAGLVAGGEDNLLANGGFEKRLDGWRVLAPTGMRYEIDRRVKKEGRRSLRVHKAGGFGGDSIRATVEGIAPGSNVVVKAWFKGKGVKNTWLKVLFHDARGQSLGQGDHVEQIRGTFDWREIKLTNKAPAGTASAEIFVLMALGGELWIDGVRMTSEKAEAPAPAKPLDAETKAFFDKHAIKVATLDFKGPLTDLTALKEQLKDVRIVQLGENSHGDGACFRAKARLVRYLYEACGFDILAFESGLFECEYANQLLREGKPDDALQASVFGIWRTSQVQPLFAYMAEVAKGRRPLRLTGFDVRGSGTHAPAFLPELYDFLEPVGELTAKEKEDLVVIDAKLGGTYRPTGSERKAGRRALLKLRSIFDGGREALTKRHGERDTFFQSWCLDNYIAREAFEYSKVEWRRTPYKQTNLRDKRMAENFRWLAEKRYPGRKIITWAATFHQAHNLKKVSIGGDDDYYRRTKAMGEYLHEWYGKRVFTIGFCAAEGRAGVMRARFTLQPPRPGSFEDLALRYGEPYLLVPLRTPGPFAKPVFCAPMAYGRQTRGPWPDVLDALFFIRVMTPSRAMER